MKYKACRGLILFSKHRIFGHYFVGSIFMVLALTILSELGVFYLIVGVIFTFLLFPPESAYETTGPSFEDNISR